MNSNFLIKLNDLDNYFEPIKNNTPGPNTGFTVKGTDLAKLYLPKTINSFPAYAPITGFKVKGVDLNQLFQPKGWAPGITQRITYTVGSGTFDPSTLTAMVGYQVYLANVLMVAGGGGAGSGVDSPSNAYDMQGGGGGGGGGFKLFQYTLNGIQSYHVGTGGLGGAIPSYNVTPGNNGQTGDSTFFDIYLCTGGPGGNGGRFNASSAFVSTVAGGYPNGGTGGGSDSTNYRTGDSGGSSTFISIICPDGTLTAGGFSGGPGAGPHGSYYAGGGGGGGASAIGVGAGPSFSTNLDNHGLNGAYYGSGASGGSDDYNGSQYQGVGGNGADGIMIIYY